MFKKFIISIALLIMSAGAMATDYSYFKSQPLTIVIPYGPGGNTDIIGRLLASRITSQTGIKTVVLNKPGGAGIIGSNYVVQAPADGFTITPTVVTNGGRWRMIAPADSSVACRGLAGHSTKPSALAPNSTAASASSRLVIPQILMAVTLLFPATQ